MSWIMWASEKPCLLSLLDDVHIPSHSRKSDATALQKDITVQKIRNPTQKIGRNQTTSNHFIFCLASAHNPKS